MAEEERAMSDKPVKTRTEIITHLSRKGTYNTITFCEERWPEIFEQNAPPEVPDNVRSMYNVISICHS
jgi:hypothetical protein